MKKLIALALAGASGALCAQTPTANPMPDGSRDMYLGLGALSEPVYEGSRDRRAASLPVLQFAWSNGVFVSGTSAGIHVSSDPTIEYGPLVAFARGRTDKGLTGTAGGVGPSAGLVKPGDFELANTQRMPMKGETRLTGMDELESRLQAGFFLNYYLGQRLRLTSSFLGGAGAKRNGAQLDLGIQHIATEIAPHHSLSLSAGLTLANRQYNAAYFGVTEHEAERSFNRVYLPQGGLKDVYLGARWNWTFNAEWLLTSGFKLTRLQGDARNSPLVERPNNATVSTALAYRF
ncbi:MipA/OmpV family protein [Massilia glaciei]|uniref:MipA/OmpV family protein n=1 Tax=Massilia glaciei TaxID=1524097 RepID=A0A2U2I4F9_9BURK|nr:MipA/OmpV family protein [Massilia glaciei]PWF54552.1 MipA/OmpV family protein [Massilia glaciei]